jgi:hypothetical protein
MSKLFRLFAFVALAAFARPVFAWNFSGHWIVAAIAYEQLTPKARANADRLIRMHPDYTNIFTKEAPADPAERARFAFIRAASWPDEIRSDPRFYDETKAGAVATPALAGFPDTKRHSTWHYYDIPYSQDGSPVELQKPPHLLSELPRLIDEVGSNDLPQAAYDLPWVLHLVGEAHEPLHATSRFLKSQPKGDAGGNFAFVPPGRTLHSLWDDAAAERDMPYAMVLSRSKELMTKKPADMSRKPGKWLDESFALVKSDVYTFGTETGTREHPVTLPPGYEENAKRVAQQRITQAGYRLAAILNAKLN